MLVLTRQRDDSIMIGDDIEVRVVDIRGDKVRLGITAPRSVSVHRREIYDQIRDENKAAAQLRPEDLTNHAQTRRGRRIVSASGRGKPRSVSAGGDC